MPSSDSTPTIRTVGVKNYRPVRALSQETVAFSATIYLDGRRAGRVTNHGTGGCNLYEFDDPAQRNAFLAYARAWAKENGKTTEPEDRLVTQLCDDYECRKLGRNAIARGAVALVLVNKNPGWFPGKPREGKPDYYVVSYVVGVFEGEEPSAVAKREGALTWRLVPTEGV